MCSTNTGVASWYRSDHRTLLLRVPSDRRKLTKIAIDYLENKNVMKALPVSAPVLQVRASLNLSC